MGVITSGAFSYTPPQFTPNQLKYYNYALSTLPSNLAEDPQIQILVALIALIVGNTQDSIDNFTNLIDVDTCPATFLPLLGAIVGYNYDYTQSPDNQRLMIKSYVRLRNLRGSSLGIQLATRYGFNTQASIDPTLYDVSISPYNFTPVIANPTNAPSLRVAGPNLFMNSDVEVITTEANVMTDSMQLGQGNWELINGGTFSFTTSGLVCNGNGLDGKNTILYGGNSDWKPMLGTDGVTGLSLSFSANFNVTSSPSGYNMIVMAYNPSSNSAYSAWQDAGTLNIDIWDFSSSSTPTTYTSTSLGSVSCTNDTSNTLTLSISPSGVLTATVVDPSTNTQLGTLSVTDTTVPFGYFMGVGAGGSSVTITNAVVTAPFPNAIQIDSTYTRTAFSVTSLNPLNGSYSLSVVPVSGEVGAIKESIPIASNTNYTGSLYYNGSLSSTPEGIGIEVDWYDSGTLLSSNSSGITSIINNSVNRFSFDALSPNSANSVEVKFSFEGTGKLTIDEFQFEIGTVANLYIRNDSTTQPSQNPSTLLAGTYDVGFSLSDSYDNETMVSPTASITIQQGEAIVVYGITYPPDAVSSNYYLGSSSTNLLYSGNSTSGTYYFTSSPTDPRNPVDVSTIPYQPVTLGGVTYQGDAIYEITVAASISTITQAMLLVNPAGFLPILRRVFEGTVQVPISNIGGVFSPWDSSRLYTRYKLFNVYQQQPVYINGTQVAYAGTQAPNMTPSVVNQFYAGVLIGSVISATRPSGETVEVAGITQVSNGSPVTFTETNFSVETLTGEYTPIQSYFISANMMSQ